MRSLLNCLAVVPFLSSLVASHPLPKRDLFLQPPHSDPFYNAPDNLDSLKEGEIYNTRTIFPEVEYALAENVVQIAFRTTDTFGNASHTVATVFSPYVPAADAKLLSVQVAEDAADIDCSPSYSIYGGALVPDGTAVIADSAIMVDWALSNGYYAVATDHEGPKSTFFAGFNEGQAGIDGIRAAFNHLSLSTDTPVALYGYSGGAHASVWMTNLVGSYAPELNVVGAAHGGTPVDPAACIRLLDGGVGAGFVVGALAGLLKAYPEQAEQIFPKLDSKLQNDIQTLYTDNTCILSEIALNPFQEIHEMTTLSDFYTYPPIKEILSNESLLSNVSSHNVSTPKFPRYIYHSVHDEIIPFGAAQQYVSEQCASGADIQFVAWPGGEHLTLEAEGLPNAIQFLQQAFDGNTPKLTCGTAAKDILTVSTEGVGSIIGGAIDDAINGLLAVITPIGQAFVDHNENHTPF